MHPVCIGVCDDVVESGVEQRTTASPTLVDPLRDRLIDELHRLRQHGLLRLKRDVVVVRHHAERMDEHREALRGPREDADDELPFVWRERRCVAVQPARHVVTTARVVLASFSSHASTYPL
jgi:hypothetical protein